MKIRPLLVVVIATVALVQNVGAEVPGPRNFVAHLSGDEEVPVRETPGGGRPGGTLADGPITSSGLLGPLLGQPITALVDALRDGLAYVNVHTNDGVTPTNTGPGDFPGGEIRGQIQGAGPR